MKALPILTFAAGAAAGAFAVWLLQSPAAPDEAKGGAVVTAKLTEENKTLADKVQSLEKQMATAAKGSGKAAASLTKIEKDGKKIITQHFDDSKMEEMMKQHAGREASREADKLALRLKLTPEQKESLKKFLLTQKDNERAMFRTAMKDGGKVEAKKGGQSKDEFLKSLLTPEQQGEYARSLEEQRMARAEEYAQRKMRKLNDQLSLSEEQKEKLFQAYAQQRLTDADPAKTPAEPADNVALSTSSIAFAAVSGDAQGAEPIQFDLDVGEIITPGGGDLDHGVMEGILTPEQLGVYDQRKAEEKENAKNLMLPGLPGVGGTAGGAVRIEVRQSDVIQTPQPK